MSNYCTVIAEAGVNHNGRLDYALRLIDAAVNAGADIVKFQTFNSELLASPKAPKADYQKKQTGNSNQLEMLKNLELSKDDYIKLFAHAKHKNIKCISTPFDIMSLDFLLGLGMDLIKIPSGEITNGPFLLSIAQKNLPIILSTGMSTLDEIEKALAVLAYGYYNPISIPKTFNDCWESWQSEYKKKGILKDKVTILHCTTNYPAHFDEINLNAIRTIENAFGIPVGYSDHSLGILVPMVAASMGATIIEKHITLDKTMDGPDHSASLEPHELKTMVEKIREIGIIKGGFEKTPSKEEFKNKPIVRRGVYAARDLEKNSNITVNDLKMLRPENDYSPMEAWDILQKPITKNYIKGEPL